MSRPELPQDLEVYVESLDEQGRATCISGHFEFKNGRLRFGAIAMDGFGGPNISATLSDETLSSLRHMGLDERAIDELITAFQRKIMEGAAHTSGRSRRRYEKKINKADDRVANSQRNQGKYLIA